MPVQQPDRQTHDCQRGEQSYAFAPEIAGRGARGEQHVAQGPQQAGHAAGQHRQRNQRDDVGIEASNTCLTRSLVERRRLAAQGLPLIRPGHAVDDDRANWSGRGLEQATADATWPFDAQQSAHRVVQQLACAEQSADDANRQRKEQVDAAQHRDAIVAAR